MEESLVAREFHYDGEGRLLVSSSHGGAEHSHVHYADGSVRITDSNDEYFEYGYSKNGDMTYVRDGGDTFVSVDYDKAGAPIAFYSGTDSVQLERDFVGRILFVQYANGSINRYTYDELGNRELVEYGNGASVHYTYDTSGNIRNIGVRNRDGSSRQQSVEVGDLNQIKRIVYGNMNQLIVFEYDSSGRPAAFDFGTERIYLRYDEFGVADSFMFESTGQIKALQQAFADADESDRILFDSRLSVLARDSHGLVQPNYGTLRFGEATFESMILDPIQSAVPGLQDARRLLRVTRSLFPRSNGSASIAQFEKPSTRCSSPTNTAP